MRDRGVSEVVGFALVFALVVSMVIIVTVSGVGTLRDARDAEQANNAERAFEVMGDNVADIYERGAPSRATEIDLKESTIFVGQPTRINVSVTDGAGNRENVTAESVPLIYRVNGDTRMVFEGGAIFRTRGDAGIVMRPPPLVSGPERTQISVLEFDGETGRAISGSTVLIRANLRGASDSQRHPEGSNLVIANATGGVKQVWYNVTSPDRAALWNRTLSSHEGVTCPDADADPRTTTCKLSSTNRIYVTKMTIGLELEE